MIKFIWLLVSFVVLGLIACFSPSASTPTTSSPKSKTEQLLQVTEFAQAILDIEKDYEAFDKEAATFLEYFWKMTAPERQQKYNELMRKLNTLQDRALAVKRPPIAEVRTAHDKYAQAMSKRMQAFTIVDPNSGINREQVAQIQSLYNEASLLYTQMREQLLDVNNKLSQ